MILKNVQIQKKQIRLSSPDGNAFVLIGMASNLAKQIGLNHEEIISEMKKGDYKNLVSIFDYYFGDYVDIIDDIDLFDDEG